MDVEALPDGALMQSLDFLLWRFSALSPDEKERFFTLRDEGERRGLLERTGFID